ncbi:MAG: hydrogenase maturation protease [Candidatus Sulfotelmatobacter sp.]
MWEIEQSDLPSDLPDFCRKPTLVFGVGNLLFGDDGFGCAVVDYVESHYPVPEDVCLLDAGTGVRKPLFTLCLSPARPQRLLILDAIDAGRSPGEIFEIDPAEIPPAKIDDFSLHLLPTSNLLRELQASCGVEVRVLACQTGPLPEEISQGLSKAVGDAVPKAAEWLVLEYFPRVVTNPDNPAAKYFAEKPRSGTSGAEAPTETEALIAALKPCATKNQSSCAESGGVA